MAHKKDTDRIQLIVRLESEQIEGIKAAAILAQTSINSVVSDAIANYLTALTVENVSPATVLHSVRQSYAQHVTTLANSPIDPSTNNPYQDIISKLGGTTT